MESYDHEPQVYIIPVNIADNGNVLNGIIRKNNLVEALIIISIGAFLWRLFFYGLSITVQAVIILPFIFLAGFALVGIGGQSIFEIMIEKYFFKKKKRRMIFKIPRVKTERKKKFFK